MSRNDHRAGARPLKRKVATRRPRKTLVVFCEGERTEPQYLLPSRVILLWRFTAPLVIRRVALTV